MPPDHIPTKRSLGSPRLGQKLGAEPCLGLIKKLIQPVQASVLLPSRRSAALQTDVGFALVFADLTAEFLLALGFLPANADQRLEGDIADIPLVRLRPRI